MIKMNSLGAFRSLTNKYTEYRKEYKNSAFTSRTKDKQDRQQSLNDSGSCLNENGKTSLLNLKMNKKGPLELQHWNLPPRYMEIFDNTSDIFKDVQLKCIVINLY